MSSLFQLLVLWHFLDFYIATMSRLYCCKLGYHFIHFFLCFTLVVKSILLIWSWYAFGTLLFLQVFDSCMVIEK